MQEEKKRSGFRYIIGLIIVVLLIPILAFTSIKRFFKKKFSVISE